ncbi:MAG: glycosyl hydrolase family 18 protein, partial [Eubacteriales bacterium]
PKTSDDQPGLLYEGLDYKAIGEYADYTLLMTYEYGYTYGPPMAVSPINEVERVLEYAVTRIPHEKILMGVPNYGYDWPLPYVRGTTKADTIGNVEAVELAWNVGADISFDETAQSPFYGYYADNIEHVVWFEDAKSIDAKLRLAARYDLAGVSYWNIMKFFPQNWLVANSLYDIRTEI